MQTSSYVVKIKFYFTPRHSDQLLNKLLYRNAKETIAEWQTYEAKGFKSTLWSVTDSEPYPSN